MPYISAKNTAAPELNPRELSRANTWESLEEKTWEELKGITWKELKSGK